ncbi:hypothetical protein TUM12151_07240 [Morganella morganii]|nr:hypothetical protein TUM12151_07240 [Morganella morganii]
MLCFSIEIFRTAHAGLLSVGEREIAAIVKESGGESNLSHYPHDNYILINSVVTMLSV